MFSSFYFLFFLAVSVILNEEVLPIPVTFSPEDRFCPFRNFQFNWILEFSLFRKHGLKSLHHKENNNISDLHAFILL